MHVLITHQTGMLLPMYAKAAFSDAAYAPIIDVSRRLAGIADFSQLSKLESWHCFWNFSSDCLKKRGASLQIGGLIVNYDHNFKHELEEMEKAANEREEQENAASELAAWVRINMRILHRKNAKYMWEEWLRMNRNHRAVEMQNLACLIQEVGHFDDTCRDSAYNLSHMSIMQDATAERDERYEKTEKRKVYGGEILEEDQLPSGPSEYSYALP